jgi:hypothetical protein
MTGGVCPYRTMASLRGVGYGKLKFALRIAEDDRLLGCRGCVDRSRTPCRAVTRWGEARGRLARRGWCCVDICGGESPTRPYQGDVIWQEVTRGALARRGSGIRRRANLSLPQGVAGDDRRWGGRRGARRTLAVAGRLRGGASSEVVSPGVGGVASIPGRRDLAGGDEGGVGAPGIRHPA